MKKKPKPIIFIQDYGTYANDVLIASGATQKEAVEFCKQKKVKKEYIDWVSNIAAFDWIEKSRSSAAFCFRDDMNGTVIVLKPYEDTWTFWESLVHELHHLVNHFADHSLMKEEPEAQAYLQEFLFKRIRRKLQKTDPL